MEKAFTLTTLFIILFFFGKTQKSAYHFQQVEGLTSNTYNFHIFKDHKGFVWISSANGLNRFDGKNVKTYLANTPIQSAIFEDTAKNLWVSSRKQLHQYHLQADSFQQHQLDTKTQAYKILDLDQARNTMLVHNNVELYEFPLDDLSALQKIDPFGIALNTTLSSVEDSYWVSMPSKNKNVNLYRWTKGKTAVNLLNISTDEISNYTFLQNKTTLWIGTERGLILVNPESAAQQTFDGLILGDKAISNITFIIELEADKLLLAAEDGLFVFDTNRKEILYEICRLENGRFASFKEQIDHLYLDQDGVLWVSIANEGVHFAKLNNYQFDALFPAQLNHAVDAISQDEAGRIWCSAADTLFIGKAAESQPVAFPFPQKNEIWSILHDNGQTWLASLNGTHRVVGMPSEQNPVTQVSNSEAFDIVKSSDGLYISSVLADVECFDEEGKKLDNEVNFVTNKNLTMYEY